MAGERVAVVAVAFLAILAVLNWRAIVDAISARGRLRDDPDSRNAKLRDNFEKAGRCIYCGCALPPPSARGTNRTCMECTPWQY
jgi:hypothetical protein